MLLFTYSYYVISDLQWIQISASESEYFTHQKNVLWMVSNFLKAKNDLNRFLFVQQRYPLPSPCSVYSPKWSSKPGRRVFILIRTIVSRLQ